MDLGDGNVLQRGSSNLGRQVQASESSAPQSPFRMSVTDQANLDWGLQISRFRTSEPVLPDAPVIAPQHRGKARRRSILKQPAACAQFGAVRTPELAAAILVMCTGYHLQLERHEAEN
jgi:hypothetical protein